MDNKELEIKYAKLQKQLSKIGYICNGTLIESYRKCGKYNCNCKDNPQMEHGPYHIWTRKEKRKTVTRSLSEKQRGLYSQYMQNFKEMESIIDNMKNISIQIIEQAKNN